MNKDKAMQQALELIERLNMRGWILADFEDEVYATLNSLKAALEQPPLPVQEQQQAEPVVWDIPSASFDQWWDSDRRRDNANPFTTDSFAYWAFEGWQAALAQRQWQGLTEEEIAVIGDKVANEDLVGLVSNFRVRLAKAIEQTLKERNHG